MKTRLLIIFLLVLVLPYGLIVYGQEQTFDEFMEWCMPQFGEKCIELYEKGSFTVSETNNNFIFGIGITMIIFTLTGYYIWRKRK